MYKVFYNINTAFLLHVSVTLVAILREVYYKGWILQDITNVCEPMNKCKILKITRSYIHLVISSFAIHFPEDGKMSDRNM